MSQAGYPVDKLRHLSAAMAYKGAAGNNVCVLRSMAFALDCRPGILTFGTVRGATPEEVAELGPNSSLIPFIHAWVEVGQTLYAPTTIERTGGQLVGMRRDGYYEVNGVTDVRPVPRATFEAIARKWNLSAALRHLRPRAGDGRLADELLAAAGVQYVLGPGRSLLPATSSERAA